MSRSSRLGRVLRACAITTVIFVLGSIAASSIAQLTLSSRPAPLAEVRSAAVALALVTTALATPMSIARAAAAVASRDLVRAWLACLATVAVGLGLYMATRIYVIYVATTLGSLESIARATELCRVADLASVSLLEIPFYALVATVGDRASSPTLSTSGRLGVGASIARVLGSALRMPLLSILGIGLEVLVCLGIGRGSSKLS